MNEGRGISLVSDTGWCCLIVSIRVGRCSYTLIPPPSHPHTQEWEASWMPCLSGVSKSTTRPARQEQFLASLVSVPEIAATAGRVVSFCGRAPYGVCHVKRLWSIAPAPPEVGLGDRSLPINVVPALTQTIIMQGNSNIDDTSVFMNNMMNVKDSVVQVGTTHTCNSTYSY